jgi:hypothetical protein
MPQEINSYHDIVSAVTWQLTEELLKGTPLRSAVYGVLQAARNMQEDLGKRRAEDLAASEASSPPFGGMQEGDDVKVMVVLGAAKGSLPG